MEQLSFELGKFRQVRRLPHVCFEPQYILLRNHANCQTLHQEHLS
jgi:hypothetical protein